jgi:hypothetical protein
MADCRLLIADLMTIANPAINQQSAISNQQFDGEPPCQRSK